MDSVRRSERGYDRLVNFSDAVVAIAITLLVLPLADLVTDWDTERYHTIWQLMEANAGMFGAFALTFAVTAMYWMVHHRMFELIGDYDYNLAWLNTLWLALVVMLPFASGVVSENGFAGGAGFVYAIMMALISMSQGLIAWYVKVHPALLVPGVTADDVHTVRSWAFAAFFCAVGVVALWAPNTASWLMILLIPLGRLLRR